MIVSLDCNVFSLKEKSIFLQIESLKLLIDTTGIIYWKHIEFICHYVCRTAGTIVKCSTFVILLNVQVFCCFLLRVSYLVSNIIQNVWAQILYILPNIHETLTLNIIFSRLKVFIILIMHLLGRVVHAKIQLIIAIIEFPHVPRSQPNLNLTEGK